MLFFLFFLMCFLIFISLLLCHFCGKNGEKIECLTLLNKEKRKINEIMDKKKFIEYLIHLKGRLKMVKIKTP